MWDYEHVVETTVTPQALWEVWADIEAWAHWSPGIAEMKVDGPFAAGTTFAMIPAPGEEPIEMRLTDVVEGEQFTDECDFGGAVVTTVHRLEPLDDGGTRVTYRTEITGAEADQLGPQIGPAITADFPDVVAALIARAHR
jgi:carbon monoxide dehydrogenase subunit G